MSDILTKIAETKHCEVGAAKALLPTASLREMAMQVQREPHSLRMAITNSTTGIIAECKRRSPSRGEIHPLADVASVVGGYEANGAAACSILTDTTYFGGSLTDLAIARQVVDLPLLRKDFIIDEYQIYQARIMGADAILLIAALLSKAQITSFIRLAHQMELETLLEFHNYDELEKYVEDTDLVGINNRDLTTFVTDVATSQMMIDKLPKSAVKVAESGIRTYADVCRLRADGYDGFLIGETFMKASDPGLALKNFLESHV